jgi:YidC/Oxa1 family membrane protein insertase
MQQKRLVLALLISTAILFLWSYFVPVKQPPENPPTAASSTPAPSASSSPSTERQSSIVNQSNIPAKEAAHRTVTIKTPLYDAKFDSRGAMPISWIIKKNKDSGNMIYSAGGDKKHPLPLELISAAGLARQAPEVPLLIITGDSAVDSVLRSTSYKIEGVESQERNVELSLSPNEKKRITFALVDQASGLNVSKSITFDAASYSTDVEVTVKRGDVVVPQVKLSIGPSIGDQGVKRYSFYSVAPEAVCFVGNRLERHSAQSINENKKSPDHLHLAGLVDWAGVGDTYFAMVAIPAKQTEGLEYYTIQYDHRNDGKSEKRYLVTALVPIAADGSRTIVYAGPKDHYLLTAESQAISSIIGRRVDLEGLIDYGWFSWVSRPLAVPILRAIKWLRQLTSSYGIAIILFTIVIYSLFFPLKWRSSKAMKKAQKLAPQMKELQEKIKGMKQTDPRLKELQMEQLRLMKEGNPLGGCLPLLIQMPFLFALYRAITISLDFRQASFLWLPDLSGGDPFHILEVLMAATMIILQLITPAPSADPLQRKMMAIGMPIFMLYVLWGAPSGLLVYWLVGNIVGFTQQFLINRWTKSDDEPQAAEANPRRRR